jgi:rhodanese-related sulfurtransferase
MLTEINRDELKQKLDHPKKFVLVEALPAQDFRTLHLPGAINIPADQVQTMAPDPLPNRDVEVIVYCAGPACHASKNAANALMELGYSNVRHYAGGKQDWISTGLPVVRDEKPTAAA